MLCWLLSWTFLVLILCIAFMWMAHDPGKCKLELVQVMAWCCQATSHCRNQCWPRSMSPYGVTRQQWVKKSLFKIMVKKRNITMMTRLRLCGWSPDLKWTNAIPPVVFGCCVFGFSLITSQLFISWKWKQKHGYWSLNVFLYVLMVECFELMILCVGICKIYFCIFFLEGTLTVSTNFFKLKIWIS